MFEMGRARRFIPSVWPSLKRLRGEEGAVGSVVADVGEDGLFEVRKGERPERALASLVECEGALFSERHFLEFLFPDLYDFNPGRAEIGEGELLEAFGCVCGGCFNCIHTGTGRKEAYGGEKPCCK